MSDTRQFASVVFGKDSSSASLLPNLEQVSVDSPAALPDAAKVDRARHQEEWIIGSGVSEEIANLAIESLDDPQEIARRLGWKAYRHTPGWWASGINPRTGERSKFGQFKPDTPISFPDRDKPAKYLTPKEVPYDALCLAHPDTHYWSAVLDDPSIPILLTEGGKKSGAALSMGLAALALVGVEMGLAKGRLVPTLAKFAVPGRPVHLAFDADLVRKPEVADALKRLATVLKRQGCLLYVTLWDEADGKGLDDYIVAHGQEEFQRKVNESIPYKEWLQKLEGQFSGKRARSQGKEDKVPGGDQGSVAALLAEKYRAQLAWHTEIKRWYRYGATQDGIWSQQADEFVWQAVIAEVGSGRSEQHGYKADFISGIVRLLKAHLAVSEWNEAAGLLPCQNGVLNLETMELIPHAPAHRLTWCLPYEYNILATCTPVQEWLLATVGGDRALVELLRGYLNAIVKGRSDLQRYLELVGPGGTGKSTYIRLAMALVGLRNTHTTTLQRLEGNRFETASICGKRLVVITDSERYAGNVSVLKAITGGDSLPYEAKFQQSTSGFTPTAMVVVAANEVVQSADYTSGLSRRRLTVPLKNQIACEQQRNLIEMRGEQLLGEFVGYLPGLLNWALAMSDEAVTNLVKRTAQHVPSLTQMKAETLCETNPIADWADHCLIHRLGERTQVGIAKRDKGAESQNTYAFVNTWLYASYCEYSTATGSKPVAVRRFVCLLDDLCASQLKLQGVSRGKDRYGSHFTGLKIRTGNDTDPLLITGKDPTDPPDSDPPPPPHHPISPRGSDPSFPSDMDKTQDVMDKTQNVMDSVMVQTLAGDECDGCDGLFETSHKALLVKNQSGFEQNQDLDFVEELKLAFHPSQEVSQTKAGDGFQPITASITASVTPVTPVTSITLTEKQDAIAPNSSIEGEIAPNPSIEDAIAKQITDAQEMLSDCEDGEAVAAVFEILATAYEGQFSQQEVDRIKSAAWLGLPPEDRQRILRLKNSDVEPPQEHQLEVSQEALVPIPEPQPQPQAQRNWQAEVLRINKRTPYQQPESPFVVGQSVMYEGVRYSVTIPGSTHSQLEGIENAISNWKLKPIT
ncbi:phage/plasmid primase, P4 family [Trichocoleus sp. Lan]|uniref:phage/plasmid primase, P4 family n=1 Tax=Trichocoleus sp. Lan TaxID=2933927 RepID=UPI003298E5D8